ncbi:MATE family efflux transporter [Bacillus amyloliquefaciens]|uniref:MATE family efflux transporter n=1 Tax=Bacillus amyloliquefaciens TaxID=1390 RepID=UPI00336B70CF
MKFAINFGANVTAFLLSVFLSVWMTPFIVKTLGVEAFGFVHLTQNIINYFSIITVALSSVVVRFFSVAAHRGNRDEANAYVSNYLAASVVISLLLAVPLAGTAFFIDRIMNVPAGLLTDVRLSIVIGSVLFMLTFFMAGFATGPFFANKLYITSSIQAVQMLVRVLCVLALFTFLPPKIWQIQLSALAGAICAAVLTFYFFKKLIPWFSFRRKALSLQTSKVLFSAGAWSSVNQIGVLLFLQIDLMTANLVLGPSEAGVYAAIIQFPLLLRSLAGTLASLFAPVLTSFYSKGDMEGLLSYANKAVRLNGLLLALPAALLGGLAEPFLSIWLGPSFVQTAPILYIHAAYLAVSLSVMPLFYVWTAFNKQKTPAVVTLCLGGLNVLLAVVLSGPAHLGLYGITIAGAVSLILKNAVFTPLYVSHITGFQKTAFYKGMFGPLAAAVFAWAVCRGIRLFSPLDSWTGLIAAGLAVCMSYAAFAFFFICTKEERRLALQKCRKVKGAVQI